MTLVSNAEQNTFVAQSRSLATNGVSHATNAEVNEHRRPSDGRTEGRWTDDGRTTDRRRTKKIQTKKFRRKNSDETIWTKKNWGQGTGARHGRCGGKARVINGDSWGAKPPRPPRGARHGTPFQKICPSGANFLK